ncbi:protein kinase [Nocardia sp. NPDC057668]|uniref:protein kinase domain-containing protein n=1 Tax=Nocardia sp. NPDC057668 TaxID=3346202 RepID=UPI0036733B17
MFEGYLIRERLGAGGMGVVYRAQHPRLKRDVALKVLHEQWSHDRSSRVAFDREAALVSQLDHPNIVQVYDRSAPGDEALWLSMRLIGGGDVATLLRGSPRGLPVEEVVALVSDAAYALDHAHAAGILHRDVKPANLLIEHDPRHGQKAVLTDFGIARAADSATTATSIAMSLPYAAPERFTAGQVDHRADVYSLGCTMFELLTGQVPFVRRAPIEFMTAHLTAAIPSLRDRRPDLPAFLDMVVATVLAKYPGERYSSCQELVTDLLRAVTATTSAPPPPEAPVAVWEDLQVFGARCAQAAYPQHAGLMFGLALVLHRRGKIIEAEAWYWQAADAGNTDAMHGLGYLLNERGEVTEAETWWRKASDNGKPGAMHDLAILLREKGAVTEAETWWRRAADAGYTDAMHGLAILLREKGAVTEAETWCRKAADAGNTNAMHGLANLLNERGEVTEAETWWRRAAETGNTSSMHNLGYLLNKQGKVTEAETWWRRAAETGDTSAMHKLGILLQRRGALTEAETWWRRAADAGDTNAMYGLANLLEAQGRAVEAGQWLQKHQEATDQSNVR